MAKLNILKLSHLAPLRTHEAGPAIAIAPEQALRRSVTSQTPWP
jgi:60 kDa SS-A/Ro ribonucleoprotein